MTTTGGAGKCLHGPHSAWPFLNTGVQTPCGELPEAYQRLYANSTLFDRAVNEAFMNAPVSTHNHIVQLW